MHIVQLHYEAFRFRDSLVLRLVIFGALLLPGLLVALVAGAWRPGICIRVFPAPRRQGPFSCNYLLHVFSFTDVSLGPLVVMDPVRYRVLLLLAYAGLSVKRWPTFSKSSLPLAMPIGMVVGYRSRILRSPSFPRPGPLVTLHARL